MTERQEFRVIRTYENLVIREYQPCVIAEVKVSAQYSTASSSAFSTLFNYISKGNKTLEKIAMTAPVIATQKDATTSDEWYVSFVMPSGSTIGRLPHPYDPQVVLRELEAETCVATAFRGRASEAKFDEMVKELRAAAAKETIALSDETRICRFDPPYKPGFMQYNEIVIPTYLSQQ